MKNQDTDPSLSHLSKADVIFWAKAGGFLLANAGLVYLGSNALKDFGYFKSPEDSGLLRSPRLGGHSPSPGTNQKIIAPSGREVHVSFSKSGDYHPINK